MSSDVDELLAEYIEHLQKTGSDADLEILCRGRPDLVAPLRRAVARFLEIETVLRGGDEVATSPADEGEAPAVSVRGFRTIEKIGGGGGGDVYKLEDLELGRVVAAKVLRGDRGLQTTAEDFLREARALALFDDPRIVRLFDLRSDLDPPVLLMEFVDGFELAKVGLSLEYSQRAAIMAEVAEAIEGAHRRGILHRDLKPGNILLDRQLRPRVLDFGLSSRSELDGYGRGTPAYMAPEQLEPDRKVGAQADVYALGVVLYELLCGVSPFRGETVDELVSRVLQAEPDLPMEVEPSVPEPLQAIALKAMERRAEDRYRSAAEMACDLRRFLAGQPVLARPTAYQSSLGQRMRPHLEHIREWHRLKLIYTHEAEQLRSAYRRLQSREDDWILHGRALSWSQITLYLGAFVVLFGSLLFFVSYTLEAVQGLLRPLLTLGLPVAGLSAVGFVLLDRGRRAVAVAFLLAGSLLVPLLVLMLTREAGLLEVSTDAVRQLFSDGWISNRQLQIACLVGAGWALAMALKTRTVALSAAWVVLLLLLHLAVLSDFGLRIWLEDGRWDLLATGLIPLCVVYAVAAAFSERRRRAWLAEPQYFFAAGLGFVILELWALDGRLLDLLGISLTELQTASVDDPLLLDTVLAMVGNGLLVYGAGWLMDRRGSELMRAPAGMLFLISPFAVLEPVFYLNTTGQYSIRFCWMYLALALLITLLSHVRQRKSFYIAGLMNTGMALWQITSRNEWFDEPFWATVVLVLGLLMLVLGSGLDAREHVRR